MSRPFPTGMRFNSSQLRLLQDSLAPPVPELEAPPDMARLKPLPEMARPKPLPDLARLQPAKTAPSQPQPRSLFPGREAASECAVFPLVSLLGLYCLGGAFLLLSASSSQELSRHGLALSSTFLAPALLLQALAGPASRASQLLGAASSLAVYSVFVLAPAGSCWPFLAAAWLASAFYGASSSPRVCLFVLPWSALSAASSAAACVLPPQYRLYAWAGSAACLAVQALATAGPLAHFELVCEARPR